LPTQQYDEFIKALEKKENLDETVNIGEAYNRGWNLPKKVIYLYNEIRKLDLSNDKHDTALSLLAKGLFVRAYRQRMDSWANKYDDVKKTHVMQPVSVRSPGSDSRLAASNRRVPRDPIADRTQILIAQTWQQQGQMAKALAAYQRVLELFPRSKWVSDARAHIQQITKREVTLDTMPAQPPGANAKINISTRNVRQITMTAYRVKLEDVLAQTARLNNPDVRFTEFAENFGSLEAAQKLFGPRAATWTFIAKDRGDHQAVQETIETPLKETGRLRHRSECGHGALCASTHHQRPGDSQENRPRLGLCLHRRCAQRRTDSGRQCSFERSLLPQRRSTRKTSIARGQSGEIGFFDKKLTRGPNIYSNNVEAFAYIGNRYAMTGQSGGYWGGYGDNRDEMKIYAYTDRPVYRPGQKVYFRQILTSRIKGGDQQPARGVKVTVRSITPRAKKSSNEYSHRASSALLTASSRCPRKHRSANTSSTPTCRRRGRTWLPAAAIASASRNTSVPNFRSRSMRPIRRCVPAKPSRPKSTRSTTSVLRFPTRT
jgi:tetratricopeptide (TPR) repeat protein